MKTKSAISLLFFFVLSLVLEACNLAGPHPLTPPTAQSNPQVLVMMITPLNGSVFSIDFPIHLVGMTGQAGASQPVINRREFLVNGASVASTGTSSNTFDGNWSPGRSGEYYVQSKVTLSDGRTAISEPVRVCVLMSLGAFAGAGGYFGPCPLATQVPDHAASGDLAVLAIAAPNSITFSTRAGCPVGLPVVNFIAYVDDPQDLVALVMVNFSNAHGSYSEWRYLNWITTRPVNQKEYRTTIEINNAFSVDNSIHWYLSAYGRSGELLQRTQDAIGISQAECSSQSLQIASPTGATGVPLNTVTGTPTPTATQGIFYIASPTKKPRKSKPAPATKQPCNPLIQVCP